MQHFFKSVAPVPRGVATDGPALFAYGFRPFFLLAGFTGVGLMGVWIGALIKGYPLGAPYGGGAWHAHEMLFGYGTAALAGFMLTAIPNWTGRLPVAGLPLAVLVAIWGVGRVAMVSAGLIGPMFAALLDLSFLPALGFVAAREIVTGKNWKNLKILVALTALFASNLSFHFSVLTTGDPAWTLRLSLATFVMLIGLVGGRIAPSFTRNKLARMGAKRLPAPFGLVDRLALFASFIALAVWVGMPETMVTAIVCALAGLLQGWRLWRWRGWAAADALIYMLHVAYGFIPLGFACLTLAALDYLSLTAALHVLTAGAIGLMTLAVMMRATLGHTGRALHATWWSVIAFSLVFVAAICRPLADIFADHYTALLNCSGVFWMVGFTLFLAEYGPMLMRPRVGRKASQRG